MEKIIYLPAAEYHKQFSAPWREARRTHRSVVPSIFNQYLVWTEFRVQ